MRGVICMPTKKVETQWGQPLNTGSFYFTGVTGQGYMETGRVYDILFQESHNSNGQTRGKLEGWYSELMEGYPILLLRDASGYVNSLHSPNIINFAIVK